MPKDCSLFHKTIEDHPLEGTLRKHRALFTLVLILCSGRMITEWIQKTNFKKTWNYSGFNEIQATRMTSCNIMIMSPWAKELRNAKSPEDIIWRLHKKAWTSLCLCTEEHLCNLPLHFLSIPLTTSYLWKVRVLINHSLSKVAQNCHIKFELAVSDFNLICCESFVIYCEWFEFVVNGLNLL